MKIIGYISLAVMLCQCFSCGRGTDAGLSAVDMLNREAFGLRYKDIEASKERSFAALKIIERETPHNYEAKAQAWNNIAYSCFLTSYFDSTRHYLSKVRAIGPDYPNRQIEEAIADITEARLFLRECRYADAFIIYDSTLTIFNGRLNRLKYNDRLPLKKFDRDRYNWARSDYLIGNAVLDYYYRNTGLPSVLKLLDEMKDDDRLHIDTTQLSILYYTYAGTYERAIPDDPSNFYLAIGNVKKGLDLLADPASRNDYYLANYYQIASAILRGRGSEPWRSKDDSVQLRAYLEKFKHEYLVGKYGWEPAEVEYTSLPLVLLEKADSIFRKYDDPYQILASSVHIGNQYLLRGDTTTAIGYYSRAMRADSVLAGRKGYARIWTRHLYNTLLKNVPDKFPASEVKRWYEIYSDESAIITENTKRDYDAQKGKAEAEELARRSMFLFFLILSVCVTVLILLYFLNRQNNKLKKARSVLHLRNEELEEYRTDLELLAKIGKQVVSTLEIDDDSKKMEFVDGIYRQIKQLKILDMLPDLSFILYIRNGNNDLQRFCKEGLDSAVDMSIHSVHDLDRPAVGCFVKYERELLSFDDWNAEYKIYADKVGIESSLIDPDLAISGNPTRSLAFLNLYGKKGDKIGVLSLQTTELGAFNKPLMQASFEIIAEYVAAALENAMQYQELRFVQKRLIEQKRMELLTYVVRGISHELSQPLGSITQTLYDTFRDIETLGGGRVKLTDEEYATIVDNINSDLRTIAQSKDAITDLVNSFRNTIKENILDPEADFNLCAKLEDVVKVIKPTIKSNINLIVDCDPGLNIRSFPLLFTQVITNLVSNANQHAFPGSDDPGDTIRIECRAKGRDLIIRCIDNGIGVQEDELDKLCQPFVSKKRTNLGLGLSLVKNIVEQYMKGEIGFSSGGGLTVTVMIPGCIIK